MRGGCPDLPPPQLESSRRFALEKNVNFVLGPLANSHPQITQKKAGRLLMSYHSLETASHFLICVSAGIFGLLLAQRVSRRPTIGSTNPCSPNKAKRSTL